MSNINKVIHREYPYKITLYRRQDWFHTFYLTYDPMGETEFQIVKFHEDRMVMFQGKYLDDAGYFKNFTLAISLADITGLKIVEEFPVSYEELDEEEELKPKVEDEDEEGLNE